MDKLNSNVNRIGALTALRFVAAIAVVLGHTQTDFSALHGFPKWFVYTQAVTFFFALSGFILTYVYPSLPDCKSIKAFIVKRCARLWPLHVATFFLQKLLVTPAAVTVSGTFPKLIVLFANIWMLHAWVPFIQFFFSYNSPSWSISVEFFFYLCFPLLLYLMRRAFWLPLAISSVMVGLFVTLCNANHFAEFSNPWSLEGLVYINPIVRIFEFITGMMTAVIFRRVKEKLDGSESSKSVAVGTGIELAAIALVGLAIFYTNPLSTAAAPFIGDAGAFWLKNSGIPILAFDLLIFVVAFGKGLVTRLLSIPPMVLLGDISYAVYLVHYPLLMYRRSYLPQEHSAYAFVAYLAVLLIMSHLLYVFLERPVRQFITNLMLNDKIDATTADAHLESCRLHRLNTNLKVTWDGLRSQFKKPGKTGLFAIELIALTILVLIIT